MAEKEKDDAPPVEPPTPPEDAPKDTPPEPSSNPVSPAEQTAKEEGEKVPAWGQVLIDQVSSLTEAITSAMPDPLDEDKNPRPEPWHKRGFRR